MQRACYSVMRTAVLRRPAPARSAAANPSTRSARAIDMRNSERHAHPELDCESGIRRVTEAQLAADSIRALVPIADLLPRADRFGDRGPIVAVKLEPLEGV